MAAYLDALADVPPLWVRRSLYVLVMDDSQRQFVPSISEIRGTAAEEIRKQWAKNNHREAWTGRSSTKIDIGHWLGVAKSEARRPVTRHLRGGDLKPVTDAKEELGF